MFKTYRSLIILEPYIAFYNTIKLNKKNYNSIISEFCLPSGYGNGLNISQPTHEMAHTWDHLQRLRGNLRVRLDHYSERNLQKIIKQSELSDSLTETNQRHRFQVENTKERISFEEMFHRYRLRIPRRQLSFHASGPNGYSLTDVREFYAEGYAVFNGGTRWLIQQARLYFYARELYNYLLQEVHGENLPTPDITQVIIETRQLPPLRST
ncbi:hypothetical protein Aeqsu_2151 [Aequorivita sublithincola DSM 14238]|uniref:Uncharacterized protein n=1 Tax=Aequorivita sublithincola (strain DSM 14238 / LMG 21431 / ACAM 643 / 9-3) TaxID=746697 RepID=I3YX94_AEQSU|nr:hypothetical protein [Aequorivita sublithincola]AFL81612.1 hypothetical protein Aeqsu_2151 [Aequorivita sublithincola DSM 14238]